MSGSRAAQTLVHCLAADPFFRDLLANLHLHLHQVNLERVVEIREIRNSRFSEFWGGYGSHWSSWWLLVLED